MTWPILPPTLQPKLDTFFWYSSARIWSIFKMDTRMDGSVLAVLAAYQNNLVTSKMMTSQVVQWFPTSERRENTTLDGKELIVRRCDVSNVAAVP